MTGDVIGYQLGLWHYADSTPSHAPPLAYTAVAIGTAAIALAGWRAERRFGMLGLFGFVIVMGLASFVADVMVGLQVLNSGLTPILYDAVLWTTVITVGQVAMRLVGGPATADRLVFV